jgi:ABC-type transporter Mla MlaB component
LARSSLNFQRSLTNEVRMLRITQTEDSAQAIHLKLEGRLSGPWVAELVRVVNQTGISAHALHIHLSGVQFVDAQGLNLLLDLLEQGAQLKERSAFVEELLRTEGTGRV